MSANSSEQRPLPGEHQDGDITNEDGTPARGEVVRAADFPNREWSYAPDNLILGREPETPHELRDYIRALDVELASIDGMENTHDALLRDIENGVIKTSPELAVNLKEKVENPEEYKEKLRQKIAEAQSRLDHLTQTT